VKLICYIWSPAGAIYGGLEILRNYDPVSWIAVATITAPKEKSRLALSRPGRESVLDARPGKTRRLFVQDGGRHPRPNLGGAGLVASKGDFRVGRRP
jgi:hypothetical protein